MQVVEMWKKIEKISYQTNYNFALRGAGLRQMAWGIASRTEATADGTEKEAKKFCLKLITMSAS